MKIQHELAIKAAPTAIYQAFSTQKGITGWWSKNCVVGEQVGEDFGVKEGNVVEMGFRTRTLQPKSSMGMHPKSKPCLDWNRDCF